MSQSFVFVSRHRVAEGALDDLAALDRAFAALVAEREPESLGLRTYLSGDGRELTHVHVQPDAAAMDRHLQLAQEHIGKALGLAPATAIEVFGSPGPVLTDVLRWNHEAGVSVTVHAHPLGEAVALAGA